MPKRTSYFPATVDLSTLSAASGVKINGQIAGDTSGWSVGFAGDFNEDGYMDVIIGAYLASRTPNTNEGMSYVVYGNATVGNNGVFELYNINGINGVAFNGKSNSEYSGYAVGLAGDLNLDGVSDIAIGAYGAGTGRVYVVLGGKSIGVGTGGSVSLSSLNGNNGFSVNGVNSGDNCGVSVGTGDFNGDGFSDLVTGAYLAAPGGKAAAGATYVVYGQSGIGSGGNLALSGLNGINGFTMNGGTAGDYSGYAVGSTDINNDNITDIIMGASHASPSGRTDAGIAYAIFGVKGGRSATVDLSTNGGSFFQLNGIANGDRMGSAVINSRADFNNDGFNDLATGSWQASPNGKANSGQTYILLGPKSGGIFEFANLNNTYKINGVSANDQSGVSVGSAGDFNGDGVPELYIGTYGSSPNGRLNAGSTYIIFGGTNITANGTLNLDTLNGINGISFQGAAGDYSGYAVDGIGDFNGDGLSDIIIGAYGASPGGRTGAGSSYIIFGDASPYWVTNTITIADCGSTILGLNNLNATDPNHNSTTFLYNINVRNGNATLINTPNTALTNFTYTQLIGGQIKVSSSCNHLPPNYSVGITTPGLAYLPQQPGTVNFIRTFAPTITNNNLKIGRGKSILVGLQNYNATSIYTFQDYMNLWFNFTGTHVTYINSALNNNTVTGAKIKDIASNVIFATHDGSANAPVLNATATDDSGLSSAPSPTNVTFIDKPYLSVALPRLYQYGNVRISNANLDASCDISCSSSSPSNLQFSFSATGAYTARYPDLITPVPVFSKQDLLAVSPAGMYIVSTGSPLQPIPSINAIDVVNSLSSGATNYTLPFVDAPQLSKNQLLSVENSTIPFNATQLYATQQYNTTDLGNILFNATCQGGGFYSYLQTSTVSLFQNFNISNGHMGFTTGSSAPNCTVILSSDQGQATSFPLIVNPRYHAGPKFGNVQIRIGQGVQNQLVSESNNLNVLNLDGDPSSYTLDILSPQHVSYSLSGGSSILSCSIDDLLQNRLFISNDDSVTTPSTSFRVTDSYGLSDTKVAVFTLVKKPQPVNATFPILYQVGAGSSIRITTDMLDSLCDAPCSTNSSSLLYTFDVQNGFITDQFSNPITQCTKRDELNGNVYLASAGINQKPVLSYNITDLANSLPSSPLMSGSFLATILSFIDVPTAFFATWNMLENVQFNLTRSLVNGTSNYIPDSGDLVLDFDPSSLQNLEIRNATNPTTSLTLGAIDANQGNMIPGPGLPVGQARICYSTQCSPYQAIPVSANSFGFAPRLNSVNFTLAEGQIQLLSLSAINYSNLNSGDSAASTLTNYLATVSAKQYIEFYAVGNNTVLSSFTLADVKNNLVEVANSGQASTFQMTLTDTSRNAPFGLTSSTRQVQPTFGYKPVVVNNAIEVNQTNSASLPAYFGTESLSASSLSSPVSSLNVLFSQQPACSVDSSGNPGNSLVPYVDLQSRSTRVTVSDPSSPTPCQFNVSFIDPNFNNVTFGPFAARVTFRDVPVVLTTLINCRQLTDQILTSSNINAKDNANNPAGITVNWLSLSNAALTFDTGSSQVSINSYTLAQQATNTVHFKPNNGAAAPVAIIQFTGNSGLATLPIVLSQDQANLIFTITHAAPVLTAGIIAPTRGVPYLLSSQAFTVTISDPTVQITDILMTISNVQFAWVQRVNNSLSPSIDMAITQYNYGESISPSTIELVPDGSANDPVICMQAETPGAEPIANLGGPVCAPVILLGKVVTPSINRNEIESISRDEELLITDDILSGISGFANDQNPGLLAWEMSCSNAELTTNVTGATSVIQDNQFKTLNITQGNIRLHASDTNNAVACTAKVTNTDGVSTEPETTLIKQFIEKYYAPTLTAYTLPLEIGLSSYPILSSYFVAIDNAGNIGGKQYPLTQPSQMSFNLSSMRGINLPEAYDASNWALIPSSVLSTLAFTDANPSIAAFNISACNLALKCSDPVAAVFNWQPSSAVTAGGGTSLSLIGGNATTYGITVAAVITGIGVLSRIFAPILSRALNSDNLERNLIVTETFGLIDKELRISNPSSCFYTSANKRGKFIRACDTIVNKLQAEGVQTQCASTVKINNKICSDCYSKDKKENDKKKELEYDKDGNQLLTGADVLNLSGIIFKHIKSICLPKKRSRCRKFCDLMCACQRDLEDKNIVDNGDIIVTAILAELRALNNLYIRKKLEVTAEQGNAIVVEMNSPSGNASSGRPLLMSLSATAAAGDRVQPDNKSDEASAEVSAASAHSGDDLVRRSSDGSKSPSASGVLLFSGAMQGGSDKAPRLEMTILGSAAGARGSRSETPPPLSGAPSITNTPPSPPALDDVPPPPMSAAL